MQAMKTQMFTFAATAKTIDFLMTNNFEVSEKPWLNALKHKPGKGLKNFQNVVDMLTPNLIFALNQRFLSTF